MATVALVARPESEIDKDNETEERDEHQDANGENHNLEPALLQGSIDG